MEAFHRNYRSNDRTLTLAGTTPASRSCSLSSSSFFCSSCEPQGGCSWISWKSILWGSASVECLDRAWLWGVYFDVYQCTISAENRFTFWIVKATVSAISCWLTSSFHSTRKNGTATYASKLHSSFWGDCWGRWGNKISQFEIQLGILTFFP